MRKLLLLVGFFLFSFTTWGQERTVSGTVTSVDDGSVIPGVSIILKGTSTGTVTDIDGNYKLDVPSTGGTLMFSFVGMATREVEVGSRSVIEVQMETDVRQLSEVVVTALNVERDKKTLGYATQEVSEENLRVARETNLNEALAGKIAGVQVISSAGSKFGASSVRIRGVRGISSQDPMYVVDGLVVDDPASINMDNVQNINVLKGASAAALYGSRARDGVIIITSKSAKKGALQVDFNNTTTFERVNNLPEFQNEYGGGYTQEFSTFSYDPSKDDPALAGLDGASIPNFSADESWGPKMDGREVAQWDAFTPGTPGYGKTRPWSPNPDNVKDFYETGVFVNNSLTIGKAEESYNVVATLSNSTRSGVLPNTNQDRSFLNLKARIDLSDKWEARAIANYNRTNTFGNLFEGYNSIGSNLNQWFQRQLDMDLLKENYQMPDGSYTSWNINSARNSRPLYWDNPYSTQYAIINETQKEVYNGRFGLSYEVIEGLTLSANLNRYFSSSWYEGYTAEGVLNVSDYTNESLQRTENNYEFMAQYQKQIGEISVSALAGGNIRENEYHRYYQSANGGLKVPGFYNIAGSVEPPTVTNQIIRKEVNSLFAQASIGYKEIIFVDASVRGDWDSALPVDDNKVVYPSVSTSFIFSELLSSQDILSFGKVRLSYAEVGSELGAYALNPAYRVGDFNFHNFPNMGTPTQVTAADLQSATTVAYEGGLELAFLKGRLRADFSYYYYDNANDIIRVDLPPGTGFSVFNANGGDGYTKGWDATISGTPVRSGDFNWDVSLNFAKSENIVEEIYPGLDTYLLPNGWRGTGTNGGWDGSARVREGEVWGTIVGTGFQRDDAGNIVVGADGVALTENDQVLGSVLPDYTGGIFNRFTYKDFELSFTIDWQIGGDYLSISEMFGNYSGLLEGTVGANDRGGNMRDDPATENGGISYGGVFEDGTPNDIYLAADKYWKSQFGVSERWVYDASYIKLREVRLGYNLPQSVLTNLPWLKRASVAFVSNNTWLISSKVDHIDPSQIVGDTRTARNNGAWVESGNLPSTRTVGFDIRLGF